jgi:hypothetical protein
MDETTASVAPATTESQPEAPPAVEQTTAPAEAAPVAVTPTWQELVEKADAKELRAHPKFAGILGSEIERARQAERQRLEAEQGTKAARAAEDRLRELARTDPVTFAEQYLSDAQRTDMQRQLDDLRGSTRREQAEAIGRALRDVPEWQHLTQEQHEKLARELLGKTDDEVLPIFFRLASEMVADAKADQRHAQWKDKELAKEREAIRQEEAAKLLKGSEAPALAKPKGAPAGTDIPSMAKEEFDAYWERLKQPR